SIIPTQIEVWLNRAQLRMVLLYHLSGILETLNARVRRKLLVPPDRAAEPDATVLKDLRASCTKITCPPLPAGARLRSTRILWREHAEKIGCANGSRVFLCLIRPGHAGPQSGSTSGPRRWGPWSSGIAGRTRCGRRPDGMHEGSRPRLDRELGRKHESRVDRSD